MEIVLVLIVSSLAFVLAALVGTAARSHVPSPLLGLAFILAVLAVARFGGILYAVPVGLVSLEAFDWYFLPPLRAVDVPTAFVLGVSIVTSVLVAEIASRAGRRAVASEEARGLLADEQAALRRVATLVARGVPPTEVSAAVAEEVGRLVSIDATRIIRYEADDTATVVAAWTEVVEMAALLRVGERLTLKGESVTALVFRTGQPARMDSYANAPPWLAKLLGETGIRSSVGAPIVVEGRLWGVIVAASAQPEPLPVGMESRLAEFTELVATAIANAETRSELTASRARVVAASDETRRRIERDLHDGIQQRLVTLALRARTAESIASQSSKDIESELSRLADGLAATLEELREVSRGIHPAILTEAGLGPALKALARRSVIPIALDVNLASPLDESLEVAVYYVASEALTNAAKHAEASVIELHVDCRDGALVLSICDDGIGGVDPARGSGIIGLTDRIEALGGKLSVVSPPGTGTTLHVELPLGPKAEQTPLHRDSATAGTRPHR